MKAFVLYLLRNRVNALLAVGLFAVLSLKAPPFALVSAAVLALVTLRRGAADGLIAVAASTAILGVGWFSLGSLPGFGFPVVAALWIPVFIGALLIRLTSSQVPALEVIGVAAAALAVAIHLAVSDVVAFWHDWLRDVVAAVPGATLRGFEDEGSIKLMNGLLVMLFGMASMASLLLGRWAQSLAFNPGAFGPEFRALRLPRLSLAIVIGLVWGVGGQNPVLTSDLLMVALMVFMFAGLAVVHALMTQFRLPVLAGVPVYLLLVYLPPLAIPVLAAIGALDALLDLRGKARAIRREN